MMTMKEFCEKMRTPIEDRDCAYYFSVRFLLVAAGGLDAMALPFPSLLQYQNDCLRSGIDVLFKDVDKNLPLGAAAFGTDLDAVNLWVGDQSATSSTHKVIPHCTSSCSLKY